MTKTKKQRRRETGIEDEQSGTSASDWFALVVVLVLFCGAVYVVNAMIVYVFPEYDLLSDLLGALEATFFPDN